MTQPSSAPAVRPETPIAKVQRVAASASFANRIVIGSPPGCDPRCRPDLRRPCDASASLPPSLLAHASTDALAAVLFGAYHLRRLDRRNSRSALMSQPAYCRVGVSGQH